jgi:hypothetical protein
MTLTLIAICLLSADTDAVKYPETIRRGTVEATPVKASIAKVPLRTFSGTTQSKDDLFILAIKLRNSSSTKRIDFDGWPEENSFTVNCRASDEHGNRCKVINFGFGQERVGDESGETIEPNGSRTAVVVFEKPIPLATQMTIDLDGAAIGQPNTRLKWLIGRQDWEQKQ